MNRYIFFIFSVVIFFSRSNAQSQSRFDKYLSVFYKQICLTDDYLIINNADYLTLENRWLTGFEYEDFLPQSFFDPNMENCYFMLNTQYKGNTIGLLQIFYNDDEINIGKYFFVMYNDSGEIIDTLCLLSGKDTYLDIDDFFMSYIILHGNEIQHVCIGPFGIDDVKASCKKITYTITERGFYYKKENDYGLVTIPGRATDIKL